MQTSEIEPAYLRISQTEPVNFHFSAQLTWIGVKLFNCAAILDFPNCIGLNAPVMTVKQVISQGFWGSKTVIHHFTDTSFAMLAYGNKYFGPQCIMYWYNYMVWPSAGFKAWRSSWGLDPIDEASFNLCRGSSGQANRMNSPPPSSSYQRTKNPCTRVNNIMKIVMHVPVCSCLLKRYFIMGNMALA